MARPFIQRRLQHFIPSDCGQHGRCAVFCVFDQILRLGLPHQNEIERFFCNIPLPVRDDGGIVVAHDVPEFQPVAVHQRAKGEGLLWQRLQFIAQCRPRRLWR